MKSGGETVKQNLPVLGICCGLCRCASAEHRPLEILPFQGWRSWGGAATCPILLPSDRRGNVCGVDFPLQKQWNSVPNQEIPMIVLYHQYHQLSAVSEKKNGFKVTFPKLEETPWFAQCLLHKGLSCIATVYVAVRRVHEKEEEMETEPAFTLGLFLELFICHICIWSSQCLDSWAKTKLKSWNNCQWW